MSALRLLNEAQRWVYRDKLILTDRAGSTRVDAVFPLCHENVFFVEQLQAPVGARVLDLCTGSGILALFAADTAKEVIGTDISHRAVQFARANAALNGLECKIEIRQGDLFDPVRGERFDVILANPPFEPTPEGWTNYLHSDGGESGTAIVEQVIERLPWYLNSGGIFQMVTYLPDDKMNLLQRLQELLPNSRVLCKRLGVLSPEMFRLDQLRRLEALESAADPLPLDCDALDYLFISVGAIGK